MFGLLKLRGPNNESLTKTSVTWSLFSSGFLIVGRIRHTQESNNCVENCQNVFVGYREDNTYVSRIEPLKMQLMKVSWSTNCVLLVSTEISTDSESKHEEV